MKRYFKTTNLVLMFAISLLIGANTLLFYNNKRLRIQNAHNDAVSFYYRDTLYLDDVFPQYANLPVYIDNDHVTIKNRKVYFKEPESLRIYDIIINIKFGEKPVTTSKEVKVRCWKEDFEYLKEETPNQLYEGSYLKLLYKKVFVRNRKDYKSVIACGDSLYEFRGDGYITFSYEGKTERINTDIKLQTSEYNQMVKGDEYLFLRNGSELIFSRDNFHTYRKVYNDRRGIKESMIWHAGTKKLLFTMYTPGEVRLRHYLLSYDPYEDKIDTLQTFYTKKDFIEYGKAPYCRHIHLITQDPYTGYIFIGVGDYEEEPAIYMSRDGGQNLECLGRGSQMWRTLSILFSKEYIFWTTDSEAPQYIYRISRNQLDSGNLIDNKDIKAFPLFNSALWCNVRVDDSSYLIGSNSEGCHYDDYHRLYRIDIDSIGIPTVYSVLEEVSLNEKDNGIKFHQTSPLCISPEGVLWCYDTHLGLRRFKIK